MWMYYRDVTGYGLIACAVLTLGARPIYPDTYTTLLYGLLIFSVFGTGLGVLAFGYFQKSQYFLYYNLGYTRRELILKTWGLNAFLGIVFVLLLHFLS